MKRLNWWQYGSHLAAVGALKYKVFKAEYADGFYATAGLGEAKHFPTQLDAINWCNEYDKKVRGV